jgi:uncharacterized protein with NRDE domain
MCLILLAHDLHPRYRLVLAANRDEFHGRPTEPLHRWPGPYGIVAGRDVRAGGTWLGVTPSGQWAAVTNFRDQFHLRRADARSRGDLVVDFLAGDAFPSEHIARIAPSASEYNGFNLLVGDGREVAWMSNRGPEGQAVHSILEPGVYGLSNDLLDTPWPKVRRGKERLREILIGGEPPSTARLLDLLMDTSLAAEHELPNTGVSPELERALSAVFIRTPEYGTRSSSAILIDRDGGIAFAERGFSPDGEVLRETRITMPG